MRVRVPGGVVVGRRLSARRSALATLATLALAGSDGLAQAAAPRLESIRASELRADVGFLAGDDLRGRLVQTPGNRVAAEFVRARFERLGLTGPAPGGSHFHDYDVVTASLAAGSSLTVIPSPGADSAVLHPGDRFFPLRFSPSGRARAGLAFAGYGMGPADGHDDYQGDAVRGRIALVLEGEPPHGRNGPFGGPVRAEAATAWRKALAAQERGAVGILLIALPEPDFAAQWRQYWPADPPRLERFAWGLLRVWADRVRIPAAQVSPQVAAQLVRGTGRSLEQLARQAATPGGFRPVVLPDVEVELVAAVNRRRIPERNVVGVLRGSDPVLQDEWILLGAHYDHNGVEGDAILAGADDNASGVSALLEIAEAYAVAAGDGHRPRRSVAFAAWNSEERGLLGSWAWVERPLVPLEHTAAVVNLDMIGRDEEVPEDGGARFRGLDPQRAAANRDAVNLLGYSRVRGGREAVESSLAASGVRLDVRFRYDSSTSQLLRRSDQWPFLHHGVPALFLHTGLHPDYHTAADRPGRINFGKLEGIARLAFQLSWDLANRTGRLEVMR